MSSNAEPICPDFELSVHESKANSSNVITMLHGTKR
jgi:hypothetical protein